MKISQQGVDFLKKEEGFRNKAYRDSVGVWTIGYGSTGSHVGPGQRISDAEGEALLREDLQRFENIVNAKIKQPMTQNQFDAMVSLAFNIGTGGFANSSVAKRFNEGDTAGAADAFKMWSRAGRHKNLLAKRRGREIAMFTGTGNTADIQNIMPRTLLADIAEKDPRAIEDFDKEGEAFMQTLQLKPDTSYTIAPPGRPPQTEARRALQGKIKTQGLEDLLGVR